MHFKTVFSLLVTLVASSEGLANAQSIEIEIQKQIFLERIRHEITHSMNTHPCAIGESGVSCNEKINLWFLSLRELLTDGRKSEVESSLLKFDWRTLSVVQQVTYLTLIRELNSNHPALSPLLYALNSATPASKIESYALCRFVSPSFCERSPRRNSIPASPSAMRDLYQNWIDLSKFQNGLYEKVPRLYMFCRTKREFPCLLIMRDKDGRPVMNGGSLWSQPQLAYSRHQKPFDQVGGNTPSGIFLINGVMPYADQLDSFGKYRRMILNFAPSSKNESILKSLLPASNRSETWWNESVTARDMGRSDFRMHGTGTINSDPSSPYYPFYGTSGCIASRENLYGGTEYQDQRLLLDTVMKALALSPSYPNETQIRGILYVVNIDDKDRAVTVQDLQTLGVL